MFRRRLFLNQEIFKMGSVFYFIDILFAGAGIYLMKKNIRKRIKSQIIIEAVPQPLIRLSDAKDCTFNAYVKPVSHNSFRSKNKGIVFFF